MTKLICTKTVMDTFGIDQQTAYGLIRFLEKMDLVDRAGPEARPVGSRGKPRLEYSVHDDASERIATMIARLRGTV